jgi:hypothetical protein
MKSYLIPLLLILVVSCKENKRGDSSYLTAADSAKADSMVSAHNSKILLDGIPYDSIGCIYIRDNGQPLFLARTFKRVPTDLEQITNRLDTIISLLKKSKR